MPLNDLFGLLAKRQTDPDKYLASSVNVVGAGQHGAIRAPFNQRRGVDSYRSWVYAAANINANAVAALPIRLYARADAPDFSSGRRAVSRSRKRYLLGDDRGERRPSTSVLRKVADFGTDFEEVTGHHPVLDVLSKANPYLNGFDLTVLRILYGELTGNGYLHPVIDEASGVPGELWPLAPQFVEVIPDEDQFVRGYLYGVDANRKQVFDPDEVIHFKRPNPGNLFYGIGKVEAAYGAVLENHAIHEMDLATFSNSARPDYAVVVKGHPTGDQLDRFQQQVEERLRGSRKDGNFITVTGDVQFTPLNFPPKDLAGREEIVEEIAAVFGVPVSMLKANDPNLASAQTGFAQWREGTILPLCRMDEQELNQSLLPLFGLEDTHVLAYDNPVPHDRAYELQERQTAVAGGWRTPNEARLEEGKEAIEDEMADRLLYGGQPLGASAPDLGLGLGPALPALPADTDVEEEETEVESLPAAMATPLNGAQVQSIVTVLDGVAGGNVSPIAAIELIVASGLDRSAAERMVQSQAEAVPEAAVEAEIELNPEDPDIAPAPKTLSLFRSGRLSKYAATKLLQSQGFSRKVAERMIEAEEKARPVEKVQRFRGEPLGDCVDRGIEVLMAEGYERDQATAIAFDQCGGKKAELRTMYRDPNDLYETAEEAEAVAALIGCEGHHTHEVEGRTLYMPCAEMSDYTELTGQEHTDPEDPTLRPEKAVEDVDLQPTAEMAELAERGLRLREEHGRGGTEVGVARARDIKNRENLSPETVARMANFFSRHRVDLDAPAADPSHDEYPSAGVIAWMLWGGDPANPDDAGNAWSERKLDELDGAREKAKNDASTPAEPSERIEGSDENPEGSASGSRGGIEISEETEKALKNKVEEHNEKHGDKKGKKVDLGMLKAVYRRGAGAFSTSHRPGMTRNQWSMARVNAFLYLVRNGRPENAKYVSDNDLLPEGHPKKEKKDKGCGCAETKAFEWPDATRKYRLEIEGLEDDFARHKAETDDPTAEDTIREGERRTPAMAIAAVALEAFSKMSETLRDEGASGVFDPLLSKAKRRTSKQETAEIRRLKKLFADLKGQVAADMEATILAAIEGGNRAAVIRLNEQLAAIGRSQLGAVALSKQIEKIATQRGKEIAKTVVDETLERFVRGLDETYSIPGDLQGRAATIARTESARAYHDGQVDAWKESGIVERKHFMLAAGACEFCRTIAKRYGEGKGKAIPVDQPVVKAGETIIGSKGGRLTVGRSMQGTVHPNCRCDFVAVLED